MAARSAAAALAPKGCLKMNSAPMKLRDGQSKTPLLQSSPPFGDISLAVLAVDSMLRRWTGRKLEASDLTARLASGAQSESETFEASSFKGYQTAQSRRRGNGGQFTRFRGLTLRASVFEWAIPLFGCRFGRFGIRLTKQM